MSVNQQPSLSTYVFVALLAGFLGGGVTAWAVLEHIGIPTTQINTAPISVLEENETIDVVQRVSPAVVSIEVSKQVANSYFELDALGRPTRKITEKNNEFQKVGGGSGFIVSEDGLIMTNRHVVFEEDARYTVVLQNGKKLPATVVARDPMSDLALLRVDEKKLPTVTLGSSDDLQIGQTVVAIGNALGEYQNSVTKGVISGVNRRVVAGGGSIRSDVIEGAIQTDAAINQGNSGGPLLNLQGQVVGINTAVSLEGQLIGFAIPMSSAKVALDSYKETGKIIRPWVGVRYVLIDESYAKANNLDITAGALLLGNGREGAVIKNGPADKAGLREDDIIIAVDGKPITESSSLSSFITNKKVGDSVKFSVLRDKKKIEVVVTLGEAQQP